MARLCWRHSYVNIRAEPTDSLAHFLNMQVNDTTNDKGKICLGVKTFYLFYLNFIYNLIAAAMLMHSII